MEETLRKNREAILDIAKLAISEDDGLIRIGKYDNELLETLLTAAYSKGAYDALNSVL